MANPSLPSRRFFRVERKYTEYDDADDCGDTHQCPAPGIAPVVADCAEN